jgi:hypothetical protein
MLLLAGNDCRRLVFPIVEDMKRGLKAIEHPSYYNGSNSIKLSSVIIVNTSISLGPYFSIIIDMDRVGYMTKMTINFLNST